MKRPARSYTGPEYTWGRRSGDSEARLCLVRTLMRTRALCPLRLSTETLSREHKDIRRSLPFTTPFTALDLLVF